jgi:hypothetical protein
MPFWDDVDPAALPDLAGQLILMKVIERLRPFQFAMQGKDIGQRYGADLKAVFLDEIDIRHPLSTSIRNALSGSTRALLLARSGG